MAITKQAVSDLLDGISESQLIEVADFVTFIRKRSEHQSFKDLEFASESSVDFWDNAIDDEVWNGV